MSPRSKRAYADSGRTLSLLSRSLFVSKVLAPAIERAGNRNRLPISRSISRGSRRLGEARAKGFEGGFSLRNGDVARRRWPGAREPLPGRACSFARSTPSVLGSARNARPGSDPDAKGRGRGAFLDLRTLSYALSGKPHTLESASEAFGVDYIKREVELGSVSAELVDYCREDVAATALSLPGTSY